MAIIRRFQCIDHMKSCVQLQTKRRVIKDKDRDAQGSSTSPGLIIIFSFGGHFPIPTDSISSGTASGVEKFDDFGSIFIF